MTSATLKGIKRSPDSKLAWTPSQLFTDGWDSECGDFRIVPSKREGALLLAFRHPDPQGGGRFWTRSFPTAEEAVEYAETF